MYGVTIEGLVKRIVKDDSIVLCLSAAAVWHELSNSWGIPLEFYYDKTKSIINSAYVRGIPVDSLDLIDYEVIHGLKVTTKEKTICDMVSTDYNPQTIYETMADYYFEHNESFDKLYNYAEKLGLCKELDKYAQDAKEYYNEW